MTSLTAIERSALLCIARAALLSLLEHKPAPVVPETGALAEVRGAFVSLHVKGELRGCVGTFGPAESLARTVARMTVSAASEDPRFPALEARELPELAISVSALCPRQPLPDPRKVRVGKDGLLVRRGWHRGALLPKVAVEHGWSAEEFLKQVCLKAGLTARAWQEEGTELESFEAEEFGEEPAT